MTHTNPIKNPRKVLFLFDGLPKELTDNQLRERSPIYTAEARFHGTEVYLTDICHDDVYRTPDDVEKELATGKYPNVKLRVGLGKGSVSFCAYQHEIRTVEDGD